MDLKLLKKEVPEKDTLIKVAFSLLGIAILIALASLIKYSQTGNLKQAVAESVILITHLKLFSIGNPVLFTLSAIGGIFVLFILFELISILFHGRFKKNIEEVRKMKTIRSLKDHIIVCGASRLGYKVVEELKKRNENFIVIDITDDVVRDLTNEDVLAVEGDSLKEEYLELANIGKAKILISCLGERADNLLQVILARKLNPNIKIVARGEVPEDVKLFKDLGADEVVLPAEIAGKEVAEKVFELEREKAGMM